MPGGILFAMLKCEKWTLIFKSFKTSKKVRGFGHLREGLILKYTCVRFRGWWWKLKTKFFTKQENYCIITIFHLQTRSR